jgi:hypothetical protein
MADQDPRAYIVDARRDSWGFVGMPKENGVYDTLSSLKKSSDSFFEVVLLGFELVNAVLDLVASFLADVTNPIKIIVDAIVSVLNSFIEDLRNAGFYWTWDRPLNDLSKLFGGYPSYEIRTVQKLLNKGDSSRPDFGADTKVFAMNFFAGVGAEGIEGIYLNVIKPIQELINVVKTDYKADIKAPIDTEVSFFKDFGFNAEIDPKDGSGDSLPDGIRVKWKLPVTKSTNPYFPRTFFAPDTFVVCVSCREQGDLIGVGVTRPREESEVTDINNSPSITLPQLIESPRPIPARLLPLLINREGIYQDILEAGDLKQGEIINVSPPQALSDIEGVPLLAYGRGEIYTRSIEGKPIKEVYKAFSFKPEVTGSGEPSFFLDIPFDALKIDRSLQEDYYVTIYSCTDGSSLKVSEVPNMEAKKIVGGRTITDVFTKPTEVDVANLSNPSATVHVDIPIRAKVDYHFAMREFFCWFLLARLSEPSARAKTSISISTELLVNLLKLMSLKTPLDVSQRLYARSGLNRESFAERVIALVDHMMKKLPSPPSSFLAQSNQEIQTLINSGYPMYELLEKTTEGGNAEGYFPMGTLRGRGSEGIIYNHTYDRTTEVRWEDLASDFGIPVEDKFISGSLYSYSPFLRQLGNGRRVQATVASLTKLPAVMKAGIKLMSAVPSNEESSGAWVNVRPFQDTDLSVFLQGVEDFKRYIEAYQKGLEGVISEILKYIRLVQQRILELKQIILKLKAIIDAILNFRLPIGLHGAYHITNGTGGLVSAVINSQNKPPIGSTGYGAGSMMVAGGLPSILVELFIALIGGEE